MRRTMLDLPRERKLGRGYTLRLMSAWEEMECRREGEELAMEERDRALCTNACLLAHVLWRNGDPLYLDGAEVLQKVTAGQIAHVAELWSKFDRESDPGPWDREAVMRAKKGWSTRLMSAFNGVCSRLLEFFRRRSGRGR